MTMYFDVADLSMVEGLSDGQAVEIVIERYADGRHRITEIIPGGESTDAPEAGMQEMDHSGHQMPEPEPPMDHSGHEMSAPEPPMDHSGHEMSEADQPMDHSGHDMEMNR